MWKLTALTLLLALAPCQAGKKPVPPPSKIPANSKLFITPMDNKLDGFIAAEIVKQKLPLVVLTEETGADYVMTGASQKVDDHWYNVIWGGKDKNEGNIRLLSVKDKTMVWAGEAGDRSLWLGNLARGGQRKIAGRLIDHMKKDLGF